MAWKRYVKRVLRALAAVGWIAVLAGWPTAVTAVAVTAPLAMSITVGVFFGLYPACRASRMDPIAALEL